jgi:hypothetical protein
MTHFRSACAVTLGAGLAFAAPAHATLIVQVTTASKTFTFADGGAGDLAPADTGTLIFNGSADGWSFSGTGVSKPSLGSAFSPETDLNAQATVPTGTKPTGATRTITFRITDTGFTLPGNTDAASGIGGTTATAMLGGKVASTAKVDYATYADAGNNPFGLGTLVASATGLTGAPKSFGADIDKLLKLGDVYSLTQVITITQTGSGQTSFDANLSLTPVSEPAALALLGSGLLGIGLIRRRR